MSPCQQGQDGVASGIGQSLEQPFLNHQPKEHWQGGVGSENRRFLPLFQEQQLHFPPTLTTEDLALLERSCANWIKASVNMETHFWHDFYYSVKVSCLPWKMTFGKSHHLFLWDVFSFTIKSLQMVVVGTVTATFIKCLLHPGISLSAATQSTRKHLTIWEL